MKEVREKEEYQELLSSYSGMPLEWEALTDKTIMITGATGMLGVFLIDLIMHRNITYHENIHIVAVSRDEKKAKDRLGDYWNSDNFTYLCQDINKPFHNEEIPRHLNYIIHGASNTHPIQYSADPIGTIDANTIGTRNVLELATLYDKCRLVFISSVEIYGENRGDTEEFTEDYCGYIDCNTLRACYTEGKRLGEAYTQAYCSQRNLDVIIPRLCRVYGPTMLSSDTKVLSQFIKKASASENIILKSDGEQKYSYIYVPDAVTALLTIMLKGKKGEAYNVSDDTSNFHLKELAEYLAMLSRCNVIYELPDEYERKGYSIATKALLNAEKLKALGWSCQYDIKKGLKQTYELLRL